MPPTSSASTGATVGEPYDLSSRVPLGLGDIPLQDLHDHWASTWAERAADTALLFERPVAPQPVDTSRFTADEVLARLRKAENTAPGSDRLTYRHWKSVDPEARFLSALFNACLHHRRTPDSWRTSRTVLIYKKGDPSIPGNWRPNSSRMHGVETIRQVPRRTPADVCARVARSAGCFFNLVVDPVIRRVQGDGDAHNILAYADDLTPLADSPQGLQQRIDLVEALATPLGLALNPAKCSTLHMCGATPVGMRPTTFTVSGVTVQALQDHHPQRFLGRPVGFRLPTRSASVVDDANRPGPRHLLVNAGAVAAVGRRQDLRLPGAQLCHAVRRVDEDRLAPPGRRRATPG
ncbi:hypothetical protein MTO96_000296 [Rhipicephalus appendiculatus]